VTPYLLLLFSTKANMQRKLRGFRWPQSKQELYALGLLLLPFIFREGHAGQRSPHRGLPPTCRLKLGTRITVRSSATPSFLTASNCCCGFPVQHISESEVSKLWHFQIKTSRAFALGPQRNACAHLLHWGAEGEHKEALVTLDFLSHAV
jgi:hypothetical protein